MRKGSPTMTYFPPHMLLCYGLKQVISSQPSMQYIIAPIYNSQSEAVTTKTCANHITTEEMSFTVDSWINQMYNHTYGVQFPDSIPHHFPQSTTVLS